MGSGPSAPPPPAPPNYQPMADASKANAESYERIMREQLDWAKTQYADNKPYSDDFRNKAMATLDENTQNSRNQLARYESLYHPLEERVLQDANNWDSAGRKQQMRDRTAATVNQQFDAADAAATRDLEGFGVDPSSTRFAALNRGSKLARAAATASAADNSDMALDREGMQLRMGATQMGKGQNATALGWQQAGTAAGGAGINAGNATTSGAAGSLGNPMGWAGATNSAIGTWGNVVNQGYQNQLNAYTAGNAALAQNANQSSGMGSIAGLAGGLGMMALMAEDGGEIPGSPSGPDAVDAAGQYLDESMSPSGGAETDDIPAVAPGGAVARLNQGEWVMPKRTVEFYGTKGMQAIIDKGDKAMGIEPQPPAAPEIKPVQKFAAGGAVSRRNGPSVATPSFHMPRMTGTGIHNMVLRAPMDRANVTSGINGFRRGVARAA